MLGRITPRLHSILLLSSLFQFYDLQVYRFSLVYQRQTIDDLSLWKELSD